MADTRTLEGKAALITGGSRGTGLATAKLLAQSGVGVSIVGRDEAQLAVARAEILDRVPGAKVVGIAANVSDPAAMVRAVEATCTQLGGVDILVNNAGIGRYGPVAEQPIDEWRQVIDVNVLGVFYATRAALPAIRQRGGGQIIAISSGAARQGYPNMSAYCTSKAALEGFMRALAAEVADEAIKCATIVPGGILTDFGIRTREERLASDGKYLEPDDVAEAVHFLLTQPVRAWTQELTLWPR